MTGPEHYRRAEQLLTKSAELTPPVAEHDLRGLQQRAQVHATLALAAATALSPARPEDFVEWSNAAGERVPSAPGVAW